ncbi:MAG TPA: hypothetical protein PK800_00980 [Syntrophorhabdaceae bacterium]|nr:hypothetical protein [Syntrophorhabdaceae bacterium]
MEENERNEFDSLLREKEQPEKSFIIEDEKRFKEKGFFSKIKDKIPLIIIVILLIICLLNIFSLSSVVSNVKDTVTDLTKKMEGINAIKASTQELESKIDALKKENDALKTEISEIKNEMEKLKTIKTKPVQGQSVKQAGQAKQKRR